MQDDRKRWKPVQNFAFGGIANPGQRPFLRGTDRQYLQQRQDELDEFERQRVAYNTALESWQQQQYNPYVEAANAYNQAAQEYNTQVYEPYAQQYAQYEQALNAWNQGPRTTDYAGPSEPQLGSTFDMAQPVAPDPFTLQAPGLPFDEAQVAAYQQQAAQRARRDAADRAVAIDVVSDPSRFNFGSMSITNRFMAKGGLVSNSQRDLSELGGAGRSPIVSPSGMVVTPSYDQGPRSEAQAMLRKLGGPVQRFAKGGSARPVSKATTVVSNPRPQAYTTQDIMNAYNQSVGSGAATEAQFVDYARGLGISDNALLAARDQMLGVSAQNDPGLTPGDIGYVAPPPPVATKPAPPPPVATKPASPPPVATKPASPPPVTQPVNHPGLTPGDIGYVAPPPPVTQPVNPPGLTPGDIGYVAPPPPVVNAPPVTQSPTSPPAVTRPPVTKPVTQPVVAPPVVTKPVVTAPPVTPAPVSPPPEVIVKPSPPPPPRPEVIVDPAPPPPQKGTGTVALTPELAISLMQRSMTTGVPTSEFNKYGGYDAVKAMYDQANGTYSLSDIPKDLLSQYANTVANTGVGNLSVLKEAGIYLTPEAIANMVKNGIDPSIIAQYSQPKKPIVAQPKIPGLLSIAPNWSSLPGYQAGTQTGVTSYAGIKPLDMTAFFNSMPSASWSRAPGPKAPVTPTAGTGASGQTGDTSQPTAPSGIPVVSPAIPSFGSIGTARSLVSAPGIGAYGPIGTAVEQLPSGTPVSSQAVPYQPLQTYSGPTAGQRISANPNLSPGVIAPNNLGYMVDRMGNRIFAPAMVPGFAKGGDASIEALTALANASNMADEEEGPKVEDYVSQARQMLDQVTPQRRATAAMPRGPGPSRGGAESPKEMDMVTESLATLKEYKPKGQKSAKAQLRELARQYALKQRAVTDEAKGLGRNTFGAPTLEKPTLVRESLSVKRFEEGGEAKKSEEVEGEDGPSASKLLRRLALAVARGVPQALTGFVDIAALPLTATGRMKAEDVVGTTDYLTKRGLLPPPQEGVASESAELLSSMASPGGAAKAAVIGMIGPKGLIEAARRSSVLKGKGLSPEPESFSAKEMLDRLREQGIDVERTWLRGKKDPEIEFIKHRPYEHLEALYEYQKRPDAIEQALRDSGKAMPLGSPGSSLSRQPGDRSSTKFNTKGGVWLTQSPTLTQTYTGDKGYVIPVYAPKPDVVVDAKGEQWADFYKKDKDWKEAFADPNVRLVEVRNVIDAGPHWTQMIPPDASEEELRAMLTATNLFAKKPFEKRVVNKLTGEPYEYKHGGAVKAPGIRKRNAH